MKQERTSYREWTPWAGWVNGIFWGAFLLVGYPLLAGWDMNLAFLPRVAIFAATLSAFVLMQHFVAGLTVLVRETHILVHLGRAGLIKTSIPFDDIVSLESVQYHPLLEFGGWGVRGWGKKKAWTARGDQAVVLTLADDRRIFIGSDRPHRLAERIRIAAKIG